MSDGEKSVLPGLRCEMTMTNTDTDTTVWQCDRTDAEVIEMYDGGTVHICPGHRSWVPALSLEL